MKGGSHEKIMIDGGQDLHIAIKRGRKIDVLLDMYNNFVGSHRWWEK